LSLVNELNYLKTQYRFSKRCTILPESLDSESRTWAFRSINEHKLDKYFRQIVETGIYTIAKHNEQYRNTLKRVNGSRLVIEENQMSSPHNRVETVKLYGSIQTIFEPWGIGVIFAGLGLIMEYILELPLSFKVADVFDTVNLLFEFKKKCVKKLKARLQCLILFIGNALIQSVTRLKLTISIET